jgi:hypothetical protein
MDNVIAAEKSCYEKSWQWAFVPAERAHKVEHCFLDARESRQAQRPIKSLRLLSGRSRVRCKKLEAAVEVHSGPARPAYSLQKPCA